MVSLVRLIWGDTWKTKSAVLGETEERGKTAESLTIRITQDLSEEKVLTEDPEKTGEIPDFRGNLTSFQLKWGLFMSPIYSSFY